MDENNNDILHDNNFMDRLETTELGEDVQNSKSFDDSKLNTTLEELEIKCSNSSRCTNESEQSLQLDADPNVIREVTEETIQATEENIVIESQANMKDNENFNGNSIKADCSDKHNECTVTHEDTTDCNLAQNKVEDVNENHVNSLKISYHEGRRPSSCGCSELDNESSASLHSREDIDDESINIDRHIVNNQSFDNALIHSEEIAEDHYDFDGHDYDEQKSECTTVSAKKSCQVVDGADEDIDGCSEVEQRFKIVNVDEDMIAEDYEVMTEGECEVVNIPTSSGESLICRQTPKDMCSSILDPVDELKKNVSLFAKNARAVVKAATSDSYFQSWDIDSLRELLAYHGVEIRGSSIAPHEFFVKVCNEIFQEDEYLPSPPDRDYDEEYIEKREQSALRIQNAYFTSLTMKRGVSKKLLNISLEYDPSHSNEGHFDDSYPRRLSSQNAEKSMFQVNDELNLKPSEFMKMNETELDEEIEMEWKKPSWRYAKRIESRNQPRRAGAAMEPYNWKTTTLGRHCMFGGCGEQLDLWDEGQISEFAQFGSGVTNYFKFLKWCSWIMLLLAIIHIPVLLINIFGAPTQYDNVFTAAITTFGNLGSAENVDFVRIPGCNEGDFQEDVCSIPKDRLALFYSSLDVCGTIVVISGILWLHKFEAKETSNLSRSTVKASDYTISVRNVPADTTEAEVKAHFAKVTGEAIASVSLAFANSNEISLYIKRGELMKKRFVCIHKIRYEKTMLKLHGEGACDRGHLNKMLKERKRLTKIIQVQDMERAQKVTSRPYAIQAFVTFKTEDGMVKALAAYQLSWHRACLCFFPRRLRFKGLKLNVEKAPEPSTILWENLEFNDLNRFCRKGLTTAIAGFAILLSIVFTFYARNFQSKNAAKTDLQCPVEFLEYPTEEKIEFVSMNTSYLHCYCSPISMFEQGRDVICQAYLRDNLESMAMNYGAAATICFMNFFFTWLMGKAGSFEKHHSITAMEASVMIRVFLLKFVNTGCLGLLFNQKWLRKIVNISLEESQADFGVQWYETGGMSIFIVIFVNIFSPHVMPYLQYKKFKAKIRKIEQNLTEDHNTSDAYKVWYTQDSLNECYVGPQFTLNHRYAQILVNFFICWMYSISMPLMPLIGAIIFYVSYWIDKFLFCHFYQIPPMYTDEMGKKSTKIIRYSVIVHLIMSIWMLGNGRIFRSKRYNSHQDYVPLDVAFGTKLEQVHLLPIILVLIGYIACNVLIKMFKISGRQSLKFFKCITCQSSNGAVSDLKRQKKQKYVKVDFSRAVDRRMIKGLASYNILHNQKYQEAFAISDEFARNKTRLSHIMGLNTKEGSLCLTENLGVVEVEEEITSERLSSQKEQILFETI